MKIFVDKKTWFDIFWRLSILALPWQTRWFSDFRLAGWPWEQGRISFYAAWVLMIATIALCVFMQRKSSSVILANAGIHQKFGWIPAFARKTSVGVLSVFGLLVISLFATHLNPLALRAVIQWWIQIALLGLFVWSIWKMRVPVRSLAAWFIVSLLPHITLGFWQYTTQLVAGSKWFGIATQLPQTRGVSVIEFGGERFLRLYGGFPHPNIFGGWLAIGFLVSVWLAATSSNRRTQIAWSVCSAVMTTALFLTFARGAWIAAIVGLCVFVGAHGLCALQKKQHQLDVSSDGAHSRDAPTAEGRHIHLRSRYGVHIGLPLLISFLTLLIIAIPNRHLLLSRFQPSNRLEQKSVTERATSLKDGLAIFGRHWLIGTGPNAELVLQPTTFSPAPLQPPHNIYVLALGNFGVVGIMLMIIILSPLRRHVVLERACRRGSWRGCLSIGRSEVVPPAAPILISLCILGLFDHYPWSTWSGQALVALSVLCMQKETTRLEREADREAM